MHGSRIEIRSSTYWQWVLKQKDMDQVGHKTWDTCIGTLLHLATVARHFLSDVFNLHIFDVH